MAEGKSPESGMHSRIAKEQGWQKLGQAKKPPGKLGRAFRAGLAAVAVVGGTVGIKETTDPGNVTGAVSETVVKSGETVSNLLRDIKGPTHEQNEAAVLLSKAKKDDDKDLLKIVIAQGGKERDKTQPIYLYDKPTTWIKGDKLENRGDVGKLAPGTIIQSAIVVEGESPFTRPASGSMVRWLAFRHPGKDEIVFAVASSFGDPGDRIYKVSPKSLK